MRSVRGGQADGREMPVGRAALIASVGGQRGWADWTNPDHRLRRLLAEFIGMAGLTFVLSGGAAILARYGGRALQPRQTVSRTVRARPRRRSGHPWRPRGSG
jgi:putative intracellular protease/amidase